MTCMLGALLPLAVAAGFISHFAIAAPLTDEWLLIYNVMTLHAAPSGPGGLVGAFRAMIWICNDHPVVVPNLIYLGIAPLFHFDARPFIFVTLACNAAILFCGYWRGLKGVPFLVAAVLVFSPARYMEMLWGFQFAFGMSVFLGVAGLALLDAAADGAHKAGPVVVGLAAILLGILCSAPAVFALPAAVIALIIRQTRFPYLGRTLLAALLAVFIYLLFYFSPLPVAAWLAHVGLIILTSIGALALSSPVGISHFAADARSIAGAMVLALDAGIILQALWQGTVARLSFGIALILYGVFTMISIAIFRPALGNWHLQCAVPIAVGNLLLVAKGLATSSAWRRVALTVIPLTAMIGYASAVLIHGPGYRAYAISVRNYLIASAQGAQTVKPYSIYFRWDSTPELALFLRDQGNPDFIVTPSPQ